MTTEELLNHIEIRGIGALWISCDIHQAPCIQTEHGHDPSDDLLNVIAEHMDQLREYCSNNIPETSGGHLLVTPAFKSSGKMTAFLSTISDRSKH